MKAEVAASLPRPHLEEPLVDQGSRELGQVVGLRRHLSRRSVKPKQHAKRNRSGTLNEP